MAIKFFFSWKSPLSYNCSACLFVPKNIYFFFKRKFIFLWEQLLGSLPQKGNKNVSPAFRKNVFFSRNICPIIQQNQYEVRAWWTGSCWKAHILWNVESRHSARQVWSQGGRNHVSSQLPARWRLPALAQTLSGPYSSDTCRPTAASCEPSSPASLCRDSFSPSSESLGLSFSWQILVSASSGRSSPTQLELTSSLLSDKKKKKKKKSSGSYHVPDTVLRASVY